MKRTLIVISVSIIILIAGYLWFSREDGPVYRETSLKKAVPVTSPFFFEFNSVRSFPFTNPLIKELVSADVGISYYSFLQGLDSLIINSDEIPGNIRNTNFILSFNVSGRDELVPLIIVKAESNNRKNRFEELIHTLYPAERFSYSNKEYGNSIITEINNGSGNERIFYSFSGSFMLISTQSIQIEQSLRQLNTEGILNDDYFVDVFSSSANREVSLFINHSDFPGFLRNILNKDPVTRVDEFGESSRFMTAARAENFRDFASWTGLDFRFYDDHVILAGTSAADDSLNHFLSVFDGQQSVNFRADHVLPQNTSFFCSYSFTSKGEFFRRLENYFEHTDFFYRREERMKRFERGVNADIRNVFQELVKNEIVLAATTIPVEPQNKSVFFILQAGNRSHAEELLLKLLSDYAKRTETDIKEMSSVYRVDENVTFPVYKFPYPSFPGIWLGVPFSMAEARYFSFFDDYVIFANSEPGLNQYLRSISAGATLAGEKSFSRIRQRGSGNNNINIFVDVNRAFGFGKEIFSGDLFNRIIGVEESLRKFTSLIWQVQNDKDKYINTLAVSYDQYGSEEAQTLWQSTIGSNIRTKPELMINHNDKNRHDIIIQDENNLLHQITPEGRVRWSVPLSGALLSRVHQVDYYKNGKLQYLFNTKEKLYLIDRDGNNVAHFPVTLASPATNGVSVFDYDNNRNYRYFVAGEDKRVYAYDTSGEIVKGWDFGQTDSPVVTPVQHFRIAGKDYIVFKDKSRIYILDRQGQERIPVKAEISNSDNPLRLVTAGSPRIAGTDISGRPFFIWFDGRFEKKRTTGFSENHLFIADDIDGDDVCDFVRVNDNEVTVIDENGRRKFSKKLKNRLKHPPVLYTFADNIKKIGVVDAVDNRIYLFDPDGKLHDGFPLQGNSEFTIGRLTDDSAGLNLLVGSEGGKLLNYSLN